MSKKSSIKNIATAQQLCELLGVPFKQFDKVMRTYVDPDKGYIDDQLQILSVPKLNELHNKLVALIDKQEKKQPRHK